VPENDFSTQHFQCAVLGVTRVTDLLFGVLASKIRVRTSVPAVGTPVDCYLRTQFLKLRNFEGIFEIARYAVLTSSDTGSVGKRVDTSGDAVVELMENAGHELVERELLPDDRLQLSRKLESWSRDPRVDVILTTGGTGMSERDVMPEATRDVITTEIPGIAEAMRARSLEVTPMAMISRAVAGIVNKTLIVNLPGSTDGVRDNLEVALQVIDHAVEVLQRSHVEDHPV